MIYEKPDLNIFASEAKSGELVEFPDIQRGWGVTENTGFIPPMEYFNAAFNRVDKAIMYLRQRGISEWQNDIEYPPEAIVQQNGKIYKCLKQNTNQNPNETQSFWELYTNSYTKEQIDEKLKGIDSYPVGAYILWSSEAKTPAGFLKADGRSLARAEYEELFNVIGYTYGGSGESFNIPNFSDGKFIRSIGGNALSLGEAQDEGMDTNSLLIKSYLPDNSGGERYEYGADGTTTAGTRGVTFIYSNSQESDIDYRGKFKKDDTYIFSSTKKANETRPYNSSVVVLIKVKNVKEATSLPDSTIYATEAKAGIVKIKNSINGNAEDMAVTEKAVNVELAGLKSQILGLEQTWQDVTSQRELNVVYTNSTPRPIMVSFSIESKVERILKVFVSGLNIITQDTDNQIHAFVNFIVPSGAEYKITIDNLKVSEAGLQGYSYWCELR